MAEFSTQVEQVGDDGSITLIRLDGFLDGATAPQLEEVLDPLLAAGNAKYIFDCKNLKYIASSGLAVFIGSYDKVTESGGDFVFIEMLPEITEVFMMLSLTDLFKMKDTMDEALAVYA